MRVLHVMDSLSCGGLETVVVNVANGLQRRGHGQFICCLRESGALSRRLDDEVSVTVLHAKPNDLRLPFRLYGLMRRVRPDVVHTENFNSWPDAALAAMCCGSIPVVHTFHGTTETTPWRRRLAGKVLSWMTSRILTVSDELRRRMARDYFLNPDRISLLPNGIDCDRYDRSVGRAALRKQLCWDSSIHCVTVASLSPVKNPLWLIDVARRTDGNIRFVWVGDGPMRTEMQQRVREANLDDRVQLVGLRDDVERWLSAADIYLQTSTGEAQPLAVMEALAAGLPVVATRVGDLEALVAADAGIVIPPGDTQSAANAVNELAADASKRKRMGSAGRDRIRRRHSLESMLDRYEALYEQVLAARPSGRRTAAPTVVCR